MSRLITNEVFGKLRVLLPVIHVDFYEQVMRNIEVAQEANADGVWLINHGGSDGEGLFDLKDRIKKDYPNLWIGLNCLDLNARQVFDFMRNNNRTADGVWTDNAMINELQPENQTFADLIDKAREGNDALYFGGVAFKYQRPVDDLGTATTIATKYVDFITTSGVGTGHAADVEKIKRMFNAANGHDIAIASGITVENVMEYIPYVTTYLVSTGICEDFYNLDLNKTKELASIIHST